MGAIKFTRRPSPVLSEHRPLYKIAQAICILGYTGRAGRASTLKINLLNWALNTKIRERALLAASSRGALPFAAWGFDPALAIALHLCEAEGLTEKTTTGHALTPAGSKFFKTLSADTEVLTSEKAFLKAIGKTLTEDMVERETKKWGQHENQRI